jgi:hypothetical protein
MFEDIYGKYYQKSTLFLYPHLGISEDSEFKPVNTYIRWYEMYTEKDCKLICIFKKEDTDSYRNFEMDKLITNPLFHDYFNLAEDMVAYVFDFSDYMEEYIRVCTGKYSELSSMFKFKILNYFNCNLLQQVYIESYLYPSKYFDKYSDMLNCDIDLLESVGELCSKPDMEQETLISKPMTSEIVNNFLHLLKQN